MGRPDYPDFAALADFEGGFAELVFYVRSHRRAVVEVSRGRKQAFIVLWECCGLRVPGRWCFRMPMVVLVDGGDGKGTPPLYALRGAEGELDIEFGWAELHYEHPLLW